jgi:hypothetical protein
MRISNDWKSGFRSLPMIGTRISIRGVVRAWVRFHGEENRIVAADAWKFAKKAHGTICRLMARMRAGSIAV